jgi:hypothetical protein
MRDYIVRQSHDRSIAVSARSPEEAVELAFLRPVDEWDSDISLLDAEESQ